MSKVQITAADVTDADMELFSDFYKECYNFRPRFRATKQDYADLANRYDEIQEEHAREEAAHLQHLRDEHGVNFANMIAYYVWHGEKSWQEHQAKIAEKAAQALLKVPGIPAVIDQWEHGDI